MKDMIIDIGPAGSFGGELVAQGTFDEILKSTSLTAKYLNGDLFQSLKNVENSKISLK
jgi:excinuclease ABC subunit A